MTASSTCAPDNGLVLASVLMSDDSTPEIKYDAPIRFIYEALIRPFADDPTPIVEMKWKTGTLIAAAPLIMRVLFEIFFNGGGLY